MIDTEVSRTFDRRSALFLSGGAILTSVLILRMLQMQVFSYKNYKKKSENNSFRIQVDLPERGKILSRNNTPISRDMPIYRIYIIPEEAKDINSLVDIVNKIQSFEVFKNGNVKLVENNEESFLQIKDNLKDLFMRIIEDEMQHIEVFKRIRDNVEFMSI